jgi:hypothetical protein
MFVLRINKSDQQLPFQYLEQIRILFLQNVKPFEQIIFEFQTEFADFVLLVSERKVTD